MVGLVVGIGRVGSNGRENIPEAVLHLGIEGLDVLVTCEWLRHDGQDRDFECKEGR